MTIGTQLAIAIGDDMTTISGTQHKVYAEAYELKDGGFRGVAKNCATGEVKRGGVRETLIKARVDADTFAREFLGSASFQVGTYRNPKNQWRCNYWVRA